MRRGVARVCQKSTQKDITCNFFLYCTSSRVPLGRASHHSEYTITLLYTGLIWDTICLMVTLFYPVCFFTFSWKVWQLQMLAVKSHSCLQAVSQHQSASNHPNEVYHQAQGHSPNTLPSVDRIPVASPSWFLHYYFDGVILLHCEHHWGQKRANHNSFCGWCMLWHCVNCILSVSE